MISTARVRDAGAIGLEVCGRSVLTEPRAYLRKDAVRKGSKASQIRGWGRRRVA
jgi:hypothetical protein